MLKLFSLTPAVFTKKKSEFIAFYGDEFFPKTCFIMWLFML